MNTPGEINTKKKVTLRWEGEDFVFDQVIELDDAGIMELQRAWEELSCAVSQANAEKKKQNEHEE